MTDWDEEALKELNSLDSARLAIRGALSTIRDLQDQMVRLKAEVQDEAARRKLAEVKTGDLQLQLERWQEQAKTWEEAEKRRASDEERYKAAVRIQVRSEESARIKESQRSLEEDLARLQAELQHMAAAQREKEAAWEQVKKRLEQREIELVQAEREKAEIALRYRQDIDAIQSLREARDREISASIKSRELEVSDRDREIAALRRRVEELQQEAAVAGKDLDLKLAAQEERYLRDHRLKEQALQERYAKREMELQSAWSEVENGLWRRAKEARDKLDKAAAEQFEERARTLADRSREIEESLKRRRQELDDDFRHRCVEAEGRYAELERALQQGWVEKEERFLKKYHQEVAAEAARLQAEWQDKLKEVDEAGAQAQRDAQKRREELENEHRRLKENLLEDAARKDAQRIRDQDDLIARKTAELERVHQEKLSELAQMEAAAAAQAQARETARREAFDEEKRLGGEELNRRRIELIEENARSLETARRVLDKEYEERGRALEGAFAAKVAEVERALQAAASQQLDFKAKLMADHALKEKNLDARWAAREAELVRRSETELEGQRADFDKKLSELQEESRQSRFREESELLRRANELEDHHSQRDRELRTDLARREEDQRRRHESQLGAAREEHRKALLVQSENAAAELARAKEEFAAQLSAARRTAEEDERRGRTLEDELRQATARAQAHWDELQSKQRVWEAERLNLELQYREREVGRERQYQEMERSLQSLWTQKEAEAVEARLKSLEAQHRHYTEQTAKAEENARRVAEEWRVHQTAELEKQKASWLSAREKDLEARRRTLESDHQQKLEVLHAELRKREVELQKQADEAGAQLRRELDEILREREKAFAARYAALERELAAKWASQTRPDEPPKPHA